MTVDELAQILKEVYDRAPHGEKNTQFQLFGIRYARELSRVSVRQVISRSGVGRNCTVEINAGRRSCGTCGTR